MYRDKRRHSQNYKLPRYYNLPRIYRILTKCHPSTCPRNFPKIAGPTHWFASILFLDVVPMLLFQQPVEMERCWRITKDEYTSVTNTDRSNFSYQRIRHDVRHQQTKRGQKHEQASHGSVGWWVENAQADPAQRAKCHADKHVRFASLAIDRQGVGHKGID